MGARERPDSSLGPGGGGEVVALLPLPLSLAGRAWRPPALALAHIGARARTGTGGSSEGAAGGAATPRDGFVTPLDQGVAAQAARGLVPDWGR